MRRKRRVGRMMSWRRRRGDVVIGLYLQLLNAG